MNPNRSRRSFLRHSACAALASAHRPVAALFSDTSKPTKPVVCLFSKHLGWIKDYDRLAERTVSLGFAGTDLTVRPGGHVLPERVEEDLPKAFESLKKAGAPIAMITTRIQDPRDPTTRKILKTASSLGIRRYRRDGEQWEGSHDPLKRIADLRGRIHELALLNKEYGLFAGMHNHSGFDLGATPWEVYELVKSEDPRWIGFKFRRGPRNHRRGLGRVEERVSPAGFGFAHSDAGTQRLCLDETRRQVGTRFLRAWPRHG